MMIGSLESRRKDDCLESIDIKQLLHDGYQPKTKMSERKLKKSKHPLKRKGIPHLHPESIPDYHESLGLPKNSQRSATPRSQPPELVHLDLQKIVRCHSEKELVKGPVQSSNKKDSQSDALYTCVLYSFTIVRLLVYPVPKPSRLVNC